MVLSGTISNINMRNGTLSCNLSLKRGLELAISSEALLRKSKEVNKRGR